MWGHIKISGGYLGDYLEDALTDALTGVKEEMAQGRCGTKRSKSGAEIRDIFQIHEKIASQIVSK